MQTRNNLQYNQNHQEHIVLIVNVHPPKKKPVPNIESEQQLVSNVHITNNTSNPSINYPTSFQSLYNQQH